MKFSKTFLVLSLGFLFLRIPPAHADAPVAKLGDTTLMESEMQKDIAMPLYEAENSLYQVKEGWITQKARTYVFDKAAKDAGLTRAAWDKKEVASKIKEPAKAEVDGLRNNFPPEKANSPEATQQIVDYLKNQQRAKREQELYGTLSKKYGVTVLIKAPEAPHIDVTYRKDDPAVGAANAPVTLIEFTDFQCPFCQRSQAVLKQVEEAYKGKVKVVARQYPLPFHPRAKPAAEVALCANEQGKFWPMREKLFAEQKLEEADFKQYAKDLGLKQPDFDTCVADHKYAARIEEDIADGQRFGVRGTPHFFVNGRPISGSQPFSAFQQIIDAELAKK